MDGHFEKLQDIRLKRTAEALRKNNLLPQSYGY